MCLVEIEGDTGRDIETHGDMRIQMEIESQKRLGMRESNDS